LFEKELGVSFEELEEGKRVVEVVPCDDSYDKKKVEIFIYEQKMIMVTIGLTTLG